MFFCPHRLYRLPFNNEPLRIVRAYISKNNHTTTDLQPCELDKRISPSYQEMAMLETMKEWDSTEEDSTHYIEIVKFFLTADDVLACMNVCY